MTSIPPGIIFINEDLNDTLKEKIKGQLWIHEAMTGSEFDARVAADPSYPDIVKFTNTRILVIRDLHDHTNREIADVVIFVKAGLAAIEKNNFGPPGLTLPVETFYIYQLLRENGKIP